MKRVVGILQDHGVYLGIIRKLTGHERISLYNQTAESLKLAPFYFSLYQIKMNSVTGLLYANGKYRLVRRPIPKVTHNRTIAFGERQRKLMKLLQERSIVFNKQNRFSKLSIARVLKENPSLHMYLPKTMAYSVANLKKAMKEMKGIYVKPVNSSVGDGIYKLTNLTSSRWGVQWRKDKVKKLSQEKLLQFLGGRIVPKSYLIQEEIELAQYNGRPYDLRVSVQRGENGAWQVTGMVGKVAAPGRHVTNVAKGGKVYPSEILLRASGFESEYAQQVISRCCLEIVRHLNSRLPGLADVGLDIGVDVRGRIHFIEMNGRDQRYTFKKAGLDSIFYRIYETPMKYAKYLLRTRDAS